MSAAIDKIYVPRDASALSLGANEVAKAIKGHIRNSALNTQLVRNGSFGLFWLEPMIEIERDGSRIAFGPVSADVIEDLFARDFATDHPLCLGPTEKIPQLEMQDRLTFSRLGFASPVDISAYQNMGGFGGLRTALEMVPQDIVDAVKESGLRGRGGAAFPTGIKWQTVHDQPGQQKYIVCNADEGDSGTFADRMLMEGDPFTLIEGMTIAGLATGATKGFIYLRSEYPHARDTLKEAIRTAYNEEFLGPDILGSGKSFDLELRMGAGAYICGEETSLLESLEGKRGMIRYKPPLPAIEGLFGKPTVINNVITLATVPIILQRGAEFYKDYGSGKSRGTLTIQLAGNVARPGLYEMAFGLPLRTLLEDIGGGTATGRPIKTVQCGGPLGPYLSERHFDLPITYEDFAGDKAMVGHGGVIVFDDNIDMAEQARFSMEFGADESCGKCTPCRIGTTRAEEVIRKIINGEDKQDNLILLEELCEVMLTGSLCAHGGLISFPVQSALMEFPEDFGLSREDVKQARARAEKPKGFEAAE